MSARHIISLGAGQFVYSFARGVLKTTRIRSEACPFQTCEQAMAAAEIIERSGQLRLGQDILVVLQ